MPGRPAARFSGLSRFISFCFAAARAGPLAARSSDRDTNLAVAPSSAPCGMRVHRRLVFTQSEWYACNAVFGRLPVPEPAGLLWDRYWNFTSGSAECRDNRPNASLGGPTRQEKLSWPDARSATALWS